MLGDGILKSLIYGDNLEDSKVYKCETGSSDKGKHPCLSQGKKQKTWNKEKAIIHKVIIIIQGIERKILNEINRQEQTLTDVENDLISRSPALIFNIIFDHIALKGYNIKIAIEDYTKTIAF